MEYINWLDSISIYAFYNEYGSVVWAITRDILAWLLSIGSFLLLGFLTHHYRRVANSIVEDETITKFDTDSNFYMSELVLGTGFGGDLEKGYQSYPDLNRGQIYNRVHGLRIIFTVLKVGILMVICGLLGAEWGILGFGAVGFLLTRSDYTARYYCEKYEKHVYKYVEEEGMEEAPLEDHVDVEEDEEEGE